MKDEVKVRIGVPEDIDAMMSLADRLLGENGLTRPNRMKVLTDIWGSLTKQNGVVGVIGGAPGEKLEAAILLKIEPLWYSDEESLIERAVFVDPDFRHARGGRARKLIEFAKKTSDVMGLPLLIGIISSQRAASKVKMYERQFGEPSGAYWIYGKKTGEWDQPIAAE
jgi:hypothetical protein